MASSAQGQPAGAEEEGGGRQEVSSCDDASPSGGGGVGWRWSGHETETDGGEAIHVSKFDSVVSCMWETGQATLGFFNGFGVRMCLFACNFSETPLKC